MIAIVWQPFLHQPCHQCRADPIFAHTLFDGGLLLAHSFWRCQKSASIRRVSNAHLPELHEVFNADEATLVKVPGSSPARATTLVALLHTALPPSHRVNAGEA